MTRSVNSVPACLCDACSSGRKPCPCPESCVLPENEAVPFLRGPDGVVAVVGVILLAAVIAADWACVLPGGCSQ